MVWAVPARRMTYYTYYTIKLKAAHQVVRRRSASSLCYGMRSIPALARQSGNVRPLSETIAHMPMHGTVAAYSDSSCCGHATKLGGLEAAASQAKDTACLCAGALACAVAVVDTIAGKALVIAAVLCVLLSATTAGCFLGVCAPVAGALVHRPALCRHCSFQSLGRVTAVMVQFF